MGSWYLGKNYRSLLRVGLSIMGRVYVSYEEWHHLEVVFGFDNTQTFRRKMTFLKRHLLVAWLSCILGSSGKLMLSMVWSCLCTVGRRYGFQEPAAERGVALGESEPGRQPMGKSCSPSAEASCGTQLLVTGRRSVWPCLQSQLLFWGKAPGCQLGYSVSALRVKVLCNIKQMQEKEEKKCSVLRYAGPKQRLSWHSCFSSFPFLLSADKRYHFGYGYHFATQRV